MKLVSYLQALLARFYSKTDADNAEIVALRRLDYGNRQILLEESASGPKTHNFVAPSDGVAFNYIQYSTKYNGFGVSATFTMLFNLDGSNTTGANSATMILVSKGESFNSHQNSIENANRMIMFVPFMGGG